MHRVTIVLCGEETESHEKLLTVIDKCNNIYYLFYWYSVWYKLDSVFYMERLVLLRLLVEESPELSTIGYQIKPTRTD